MGGFLCVVYILLTTLPACAPDSPAHGSRLTPYGSPPDHRFG
jgi:hypothetical protein